MHLPWPELKYWDTGEFQVVQEKIDDLAHEGILINPRPKDRYAALKRTPLSHTKVALLGQDPYPDPAFACGYAYSVPASIPRNKLPPTLLNVFKEYEDDLKLPAPTTGDLTVWADRGVLLWNTIPTCTAFKSLSHDWSEWEALTAEILKLVNEKGAVIVLMGRRAQKLQRLIDDRLSSVIYTSHPSPLAYKGGKVPANSFLGSRLFSTINTKLCEDGAEPIDWRLP